MLPEYVEEINDDEVIFRNFHGQRFTYKQPKRYDGSETPDIVPIEIAAKKQRTAAKKASRPRRRKASGEWASCSTFHGMSTCCSVVTLVLVASVAACADSTAPSRAESWSFEDGMEGWAVAAADTELGDNHVEWWARLSTAEASSGSWSVEIFMNNMNDATKVWIHRELSVDPNRDYDVHLAYDFASADWGDANLFALLAGASPTPPTTGPKVLNVARTGQRTGNGAAFDVGYLWSRKEFGLQARSSAVGNLYVLVGVWGTWETSRTHYIDNVTVRLMPR